MSDDRLVEFGEWLKEQRVASRWSRRKLAEIAGISDSSWANYERGGRIQDGKWWVQRPGVETLRGIAKALQIPEAEVFDRAGAMLPVEVAAAEASDDDRWIARRLEEAGIPPGPASEVRLTDRRQRMMSPGADEASQEQSDALLQQMAGMAEEIRKLRSLVERAILDGLLK